MRAAYDRLTQASHKLAEALYKANAPQAQGGPADAGDSGGSASGSEAKKDEGVIDAEYVDVDDKK